MPGTGTMTIQNSMTQGKNIYITCIDYQSGCMDNPNPGDVIGLVKSGHPVQLLCNRRGGHGCDGNQGFFALEVLVNSEPAGIQLFQIDGDGGLAFNGSLIPVPGYAIGFTSQLSGGGNSVTWIITDL